MFFPKNRLTNLVQTAVTDTQALINNVVSVVTGQALIDNIANRVKNQLVASLSISDQTISYNSSTGTEIGTVTLPESTECKMQDFTINNAVADTTEEGYTYSQTFTWTGIRSTDFLKVIILSGTFEGNVAVKGITDGVTVYFDDNPTQSVVVRVYVYQPDLGLVTPDAAVNLQSQITSINSDIDVINGNFATIEESSTSTHAYSINDYLVYNGLLYKVTAAIDIGDTIATGTNVAITTTGTELSELTGRNVYSTAEKVVGTWIGGKPLYRRVIDCGLIPAGVLNNTNIYTFPNTIEFVLLKYAWAFDSSTNMYTSLDYGSGGTEQSKLSITVARNDNVISGQWYIRLGSQTDRTLFGKVMVVVEYTKSTD